MKQDVERMVAKEEAQHYGAIFDEGEIERSVRKEDEAYNDWKEWALKETEREKQRQSGALPGAAPEPEQEENPIGQQLSPLEEAQVISGDRSTQPTTSGAQ